MQPRLVQVGLGPLGRILLRDLLERGLGRLVAVVDVDPELVGRDLREVAPELPAAAAGIVISGGLERAPEFDAAIVSTTSDLALCAPTLHALLARGAAVVSTCEELLFPWLRHAELAQELDEAARAHGGRLLGTGVNPGFVMDALPCFASSVCHAVERVEVWRVQDASTRRVPFQRKIGAGLSTVEFEREAASGRLRHVGLGESLHLVARVLGLELASWSETLEPVLASAPLTCGLGPIPAGHAAGVRQVAEGLDAAGRARARLEFVAAIGQADPHDRVRLEGRPDLDLRIEGGVHGDVATSAVVLNSLRPLLAAPAGLHTVASLPMAACSPP